MRLKEAKLCCAFSWSPASLVSGTMIATGSVAGAMDDDFNSEAFLEIRRVDVNDTLSTEMPVIGRTLMPDRVFRIDWSPHGGSHGIIAGCFTDGSVQVWSVDVMLRNFEANAASGGEAEDPVLCRIQAHTGSCRALQFSPTQPHFLATGGQDKELCIWTLQNPREPAAVPALPKATHPGEITDVRWSPKFAHIIAAATVVGTVVVWDLKARRTALSFNVSANQPGSATCLAWHPDVSTHIAVARDDVNPVVQLWDLKKAMAPTRELRGHAKGITGLSWNQEDPSLLLSCSCDGRTMCWNPNTGDLLGHLPVQDNWVYEVQWCPKFATVVATSSFDSSLGVFSAQEISSGGSTGRTVPKWLRRPCGAVFGFGGRIVAPIKGSVSTLASSVTTQGDATGDQRFRQSIVENPPHTPQRVELLKSLGYGLLAASEESSLQGNRTPLLAYLGVDPSAVEAEVDNVGPVFSLEEEEFSQLLSRCVVSGRVEAGVKLCLAAGRLDDAFAVAQLASQPTNLTLDVLRQYTAAATNTGALRHLRYLKAVLLDAYAEAVADATLPWKELLALILTYVSPDRFGQVAAALGIGLRERGEHKGAGAVFTLSGNVDAVAELYDVMALSSQSFVQQITLLEQTVGVGCTSAAFAQALSSYATVLANAGDFEGALQLSNRAANLGDAKAAVVADRIQYHVPSAAAVRVGFPFTLALIPDATSIECHMLGSKQQTQPQFASNAAVSPTTGMPSMASIQPLGQSRTASHPHQNQPQQHAAILSGAGQSTSVTPSPYPQHPGSTPPVGSTGAAVGGAAPAGWGSAPPGMDPRGRQGGPSPPGVFGTPTNEGGSMSGGYVPPALPAHARTDGPQAQYSGTGVAAAGGYATAATTSGGVPPSASSTHVGSVGAVNAPPALHSAHGQATYSVAQTAATGSAMTATPSYHDPVVGGSTHAAAQPRNTTPGGLSSVPASATGVTKPATAPAAAMPPAAISSFDVGSLSNTMHQSIATGILDGISRVTDKRKRDAIEKSANELFEKLRRGEISDPVAEMIQSFVQSLGTPSSKEHWRRLSDTHYNVVQSFLNIKFL